MKSVFTFLFSIVSRLRKTPSLSKGSNKPRKDNVLLEGLTLRANTTQCTIRTHTLPG